MKNILLTLVTIILTSPFVAGQYGNVIFEDYFSNNDNSWAIKDDNDLTLQLQYGKYSFYHKREKGSWLSWKSVTIDTQRDFSISCNTLWTEGIENNGYGFIWGTKNADNYFSFEISANGYYRHTLCLGGTFHSIISWTSSTAINKKGSNSLRINKQGSAVLFYINDTKVNETNFDEFLDNKVGFTVSQKQRILYDDLVVKYTDSPSTKPAKKYIFKDNFDTNENKWAENDGSSNGAKISVVDGKYSFEHLRESSTWLSWRGVDVDTKRDFSFSCNTLWVSGIENNGYGFIWGATDDKNYYAFEVSANGYYRVRMVVESKTQDLIGWTKSDYIFQKSSNNLRVNKKGSSLEFYINNKYVTRYNFSDFFGAKTGLVVSQKQKILFDDFYVIYTDDLPFNQIIQDNVISEKVTPPILLISDIRFTDANGNNRIDGNEECKISFTLTNRGSGPAQDLKAKITNSSSVSGLNYNYTTSLGTIAANTTKTISVPISGSLALTTGTASIKLSFEEKLGFPPDPIELNIETREFLKPNVQVVDHSFLTDNGYIRLGFPVQLKVLVQNIGQGVAESVRVSAQYPVSNVFPNGPKDFDIGIMQPGASKELVFEFIANKLYTDKSIPVTAIISEKHGKYAQNKSVYASIDAKSSSTQINIASNVVDTKVDIQVASLSAEVDKNIPVNPVKSPSRYALIIGNENYSSRQKGLNTEVDVAFAVNDAKIFKEYCEKTLGVEEQNIFLLTNATSAEMSQKIELVSQILSRLGSSGELIFFYAGHGFPDENTREPYLIPVDVSATNLPSAIKLHDIYKKFAQTGAKRVTVFLDACFTGGGRESGLLAARAVKVTPRQETILGNMVIFAATSEDQSALPYTDKQHGMFTFFLLKILQETKGDITYSALEEYIRKNVSIESLRVNYKPQDPKASVSPQAVDKWEMWRMR